MAGYRLKIQLALTQRLYSYDSSGNTTESALAGSSPAATTGVTELANSSNQIATLGEVSRLSEMAIEFVLTKNSNKKKAPAGENPPRLQLENFVLANYGARRQTGDL
jgi:hypothetical protein